MRVLRFLICLLSMVTLLLIGYCRERYVFNFLDPSASGFLLPRLLPDYGSYPMTMDGVIKAFFTDPRWLSTVFQFIIIPLATAGLVYGVFGQRRYFAFTVGIYLCVVVLCALAIGFSMLTSNYAYGYSLAQQLKDLAQLPFVAIFLIPAFRLYEMGR